MPTIYTCSKCRKGFMTSTYGIVEHYDKCTAGKVNLTNASKATKRCKIQPP